MKVKKLFLPLILAFLLVPCTMFFAGCGEDKITDVRVRGVKQTFELNEEFSFGDNVRVEKQINGEKWEDVGSGAYSYNSQKSTFNSAVAGEYVIYVSISGTDKEVSYTIEVQKGNTSFVSINPLNATYGQRLSDLTLPQGYAWVNPNAEVGFVTNQDGREFDVTYTKNSNYNPVNSKVKVIVGKANTDFVAIGPLHATYGQTLDDIDLPMGYYWHQSNQSVGDVTGSEGREFDIRYLKNVNYNPVSGKVKIIVAKADLAFVPINALNATYGQNLSDLTLPQGYTWLNPNASVGNATDANGREFDVIYELDSNHKTAQGKVKVVVAKANADFVAITLNATYGQTLADISLPQGYAWVTPTSSVGDVTNANGREFDATYLKSDNHNVALGKIKVVVAKADLTFAPINPINATYGQSLSDLTLPQGYTWLNPNASVGNATDANGREFDVIYELDSNHKTAQGKVKVVVAKANANFVAIEPINAFVGQTLADISLPQGYTWVNPSESVGEETLVGRNFAVTYTKDENHNAVNGEVKVVVSKKSLTIQTKPTASVATVYFPLSSSVLSGGLVTYDNQPVEGTFSWENSEEIINTKGTLSFNAKFTPNSNEYNAINDIEVNVVVNAYDLSNANIELMQNEYYFANGPIEAEIKSIKDKTLTSVVIPAKNASDEENYLVYYTSNDKVGKAVMQVRGAGNCTGQVMLNFDIIKKLIGVKFINSHTTFEFYADDEINLYDEIKAYKKYEHFEGENLPEDVLASNEFQFLTANKEAFNPALYDEEQELYAWYNEYQSEEKITVTIHSLKVISFNVDISSFKKVYTVGEDIVLDGTNIVVKETYNSQKEVTLTYSNTAKAGSYTITSDYDKTNAGEYTITIKSFYKNELLQEEKFEFTVKVETAKVLSGISSIELANKYYLGVEASDLLFNIFVYYNDDYSLIEFHSQVSGDEVQFMSSIYGDAQVVEFNPNTTDAQYVKASVEGGAHELTYTFYLYEDQVLDGYIEYKGLKYGSATTITIPYKDSTFKQDLKAYYEFESGKTELYDGIEGLDDLDTSIPNSSVSIYFDKTGYGYYGLSLVVGEAPKSTNVTFSYKQNEGDDYTLLNGDGNNYEMTANFGKDTIYLSLEFESPTASIDGYYYFGTSLESSQGFSIDPYNPTMNITGLLSSPSDVTVYFCVKDSGLANKEITLTIKRENPFNVIKVNNNDLTFEEFLSLDAMEYNGLLELELKDSSNFTLYLDSQQVNTIQVSKSYIDIEILNNEQVQVFRKTLEIIVFKSLEIGKAGNNFTYSNIKYGDMFDYELERTQTDLTIKLSTISTLSELYVNFNGEELEPINGDIVINNAQDIFSITIMRPLGDGSYTSIATISIQAFSYLSEVEVLTLGNYGDEYNAQLERFRSTSEVNGMTTDYSLNISSNEVLTGMNFVMKSEYSNFTAGLYNLDDTEFDFTNYNQVQVLKIKVFDANDDLVDTLLVDFYQMLSYEISNAQRYYGSNKNYAFTTSDECVVYTSTDNFEITTQTSVNNLTQYGILTHNFVCEVTIEGYSKVSISASVEINYSEQDFNSLFNYMNVIIIDGYNEYNNNVDGTFSMFNQSLPIIYSLDDIVAQLNANEYGSAYSLIDSNSTCVFSRDGNNIKYVVTDGEQNEIIGFIKVFYQGVVNNDVTIKSIVLYGMTQGIIESFDPASNAITLEDMNKTKALSVVTVNEYAKVQLFKANDLANAIITQFGDAYLSFEEAGNYVIKITATDGLTTKTINVTANGEFAPMLEVTFGQDTYYFDIDMQTYEMKGDFSAVIGQYGYEQIYVYVGERETNQGKVSLSAISCFEDNIYDKDYNKINDLTNLQLDVLNEDGIDYAMVYVDAGGMMMPVYFYLCDKLVPLTITIGTKSFIVEYDDSQIMNGKLGDFTATSMMNPDFKATATMAELGLDSIPQTVNGTIKFGMVYQDNAYAVKTEYEGEFISPSEGNLEFANTAFTITPASPGTNATIIFIVNLVVGGNTAMLPLTIEILDTAITA